MIKRQDILRFMAQGATIVTPTKRLAVALQTAYIQQSGQKTRAKPACMPYQAFLTDRFQKLTHRTSAQPHPLLLSQQQFHHLWFKILSSSEVPVNQGLVNAVCDAWVQCQRWQLDMHDPLFTTTPQTQLFQNWSLQMQKALDVFPALAEEQLAPYLIKHAKELPLKHCIWVCFDDFNPQQLGLIRSLQEHGCQIDYTDLESHCDKEYLFKAENERDEYQHVVYWLQEQIQRGPQRIAIIVPTLEEKASSLLRFLQHQLPDTEFDLSLGKVLQSFPLASHALQWLSLDAHSLSNHQARLLLHSPYLAGARQELLLRAQFLQDSISLQEETISWKFFLLELQEKIPSFYQQLAAITPYPTTASPAIWADEYLQRLKILGFPGDYSLNSLNYQTCQRFLSLLEEFRQLQLVSSSLTAEEALSTLTSMAATTVFQPQNENPDVQILGLLEASGCVFDALWVCNMTDECLPQKAKLNPFIPISLQKNRNMPHSNAERELNLARKHLERLRKSCAQVVFSYAQLAQDKPQLPSPLLQHIPAYQPQIVRITPRSVSLDRQLDCWQLPLGENEKISGGTSLLAKQAKCPFQAFAAHRLHAKITAETSDGLNNLERGQLTHKVLELIWQQLGDQRTLLAITDDALTQIIERAIYTAVAPYSKARQYSFAPLIQAVEFRRLTRLIQAFLDWEKQRPEFRVEALEKSYRVTLGGIDFNLRVDRIDQLSNGQKWVIDYKNSLPTALPWNEERPREPQLLFYALLDEAIDTLVYASWKSGQAMCAGLSQHEHSIKGIKAVKSDWESQRGQWKEQLELLAKEFQEGICVPKPAKTSICQQCDFQSLCRMHHYVSEDTE